LLNEDSGAAKIYYERVGTLTALHPSDQYNLALALEGLGETKRAEAIMKQLATNDGRGHPRAHQWLARRLRLDQGVFESPEQLEAAYQQLLAAREVLPESADVNFKLAQISLAIGNIESAVMYLSDAAKRNPNWWFELANLHARLGQKELALEANLKASEYCHGQLRETPFDEGLRLRYASIQMNLSDFDGAVSTLREGVKLHPDGAFQKALATAYVAQFDRLQNSETASPIDLLELLRLALQADQENRAAMVRLIGLGERSPEDAERAKELLRTLLASGHGTGFVHFALGCRAWREDDADKALWHLERAYKLDDDLGVVANNLAWVLAHQHPPDLARALRVIDSVVKRWPDMAEYRDTRGQILVQMERWEDALDDLEVALRGMPSNAGVHNSLARVYGELGNAELARKHTEIAEYLATREAE
jgi:tetratricopeptide (TPR) repeat protein